MRAWLGGWGAELTDSQRACAFAAAGVLSANGSSRSDDLQLADGPVRWTWPDLGELRDAKSFAIAWERVRRGRPVRLRIEYVEEPLRGAALEAQAWLCRNVVIGDGAATVVVDHVHRRPGWRWPLDVAVVPGAQGESLAAQLQRAYFVGQGLASMRRLGAPHWRTSVLILDQTLVESAAAILALHRSVRASIVVVLGAPASNLDRTVASMRLILDITHAHAVAVGAADPGNGARPFLDGLVKHMANNAPLDLALTHASDAGTLIVATDEIIEQMRVSKRLLAVAKDLSEVAETFPSGLSGLGSIGGMSLKAKNGGLARDIEEAMPPQAWVHETEAASGVSQAVDILDEEIAKAPPRWLQSQLQRDDKAVEVARRGLTHTIAVMVGPRDPMFRAGSSPVAHLPHSDHDEQLMVVLTDPVLAPDPLVQWITLPAAGPSSRASFPLTTTDTTERIEARITLLHDGRVLQTGVLHAECDGKTPYTFRTDAVARARLSGFGRRRHFGAAFIANHTQKNALGFLLADAHGKAARLAIGANDIKGLADAMSLGFDIVNGDATTKRTLRDKSSVDALIKLARHGGTFYEALIANNDIKPALRTTDPIQIVSAHPDAFFPLELAYCYPIPKHDAVLCEHAEAALARGSCDSSCRKLDSTRVCPLGFWSLRRVIERCTFRPEDKKAIEADFGILVEPLRGRSSLVKPERAALAASDIASKKLKGASKKLAAKLHKLFGGAAPRAMTKWDAWTKDVLANPWPALLVLVPHHASENGEEFLEIGKENGDERLYSPDLAPEHVIGDRAAESAPRPIVLLAGCETALSAISYESFVARFRLKGAAVVLGTISAVLGMDAAPVAGELAVELVKAFGHKPPRTIGDAMLAVRRRLVAKGRVMVLSVAAYGDADWQLE